MNYTKIDKRREERSQIALSRKLRIESSEYEGLRIRETPMISEKSNKRIRIQGRVVDIRNLGKLTFADILDEKDKIQLLISDEEDNLSKEFGSCIDTGDLIDAYGSVGKTKSGQLAVNLRDFRLIAKCLHVFPRQLKDKEKRFSHRFLDLTINKKSREIVEISSLVSKGTRQFLWTKGFDEYQTPIISTQYNGGAATPFTTEIRSISKLGYLRVTSEIYLKQLISAGFLSVFEIGSQFRNEGLDNYHLPEFQMLEIYEAFSDAQDMLDLTLELVESISTLIHGRPIFFSNGIEFNCGKADWMEINARDTIKAQTGIDILENLDSVKHDAISIGINCADDASYATIVAKFIDTFIRESTTKPTIISGLPFGMTPLMKASDTDKMFADRFWLFAGSIDFCDIGSEQTTFSEQLIALQNQYEQLRKTHQHARINTDIVKVQAFGLPPIGGVGMSLSRLAMILADIKDIRESPSFPTH